MVSYAHPILVDDIDGNGHGHGIIEEEDAFLRFVDYARSMFSPEENRDSNGNGEDNAGPGWSWIVSRILKTCKAYSSGVTSAILLSDLSQAWNEQHRAGAPKRRPECITQLRKSHRRTRLPHTVTIDSIYEKNFLPVNSILEAVILDAFLLPGTNIYMLSLGDFWSSSTIDLYLHRRYYDLANPDNGILKKGREICLTGCCLPTPNVELIVIYLLFTFFFFLFLIQDQDDDAMLLGAQFCSDSFSTISLDAVKNGASYSFYAKQSSIDTRIQKSNKKAHKKKVVGQLGHGRASCFLLTIEGRLRSNGFSCGMVRRIMLALDRPFIASAIEACEELCLEYGSATQLYLVPFIQHEEQVCVASTQNRYQGLRLSNTLVQSQDPKVSQVTLPCDSQGSIDFSNYPFQSFVINLRDKMTSISLYGVVTNIFRERNTAETIFSLKIEDTTGALLAKLHFPRSWSLGRLGLGHTVYMSGLTCSMTPQKLVEVSWFEKDAGASFVNLSCLPALLNSSCLHKLSYLSDLTSKKNITHICLVRLDQIEHCHVNTRFSHSLCGHFVNEKPGGFVECNFCHCNCDAAVVRTFHLKITLADEVTKVFAWCTGQTATELLQISPDEFYELPEEEQAMYPSSLENERFTVALVNCQRQCYGPGGCLIQENDSVAWEITRALKV
ncbi:hypothetical protein HHK36_026293 [Tetracentron sinense]|uniref:Cell division control protein 24 OB domain-containing protein n=1 Tax=Tetracentron sinense TaxID=13715 RepID=A0A834YGJ2_TETSI|nr:hypothetical protein HHK36_026293 [Tetracentron sinense]